MQFVFLRAINTGGRRVTNDQQLEPFKTAGFTDVDAYQAAGNIVVRSERPVTSTALDPLLAAAYGFETSTFVRSAPELQQVVDAQPFASEQLAATSGKVQVAFMAGSPSPAAMDGVMSLVPAADSVVVADTEWYWLPLDGISGSSLPVAAIERLVGPMTIRTLGTLQRMLTKFT